MTEHRPAQRRAPGHVAWIAILLTAGLLQGCSEPRTGPASVRRVYAADVTGAARLCQAPKLTPESGQTVETAIGMGNDGGWCGVTLQMGGSRPYAAGLLTARPAHGDVLIHQVGDYTRIDYTPDRGFTGSDKFSVKLVPGGTTVQVTVSVAGTATKG